MPNTPWLRPVAAACLLATIAAPGCASREPFCKVYPPEVADPLLRSMMGTWHIDRSIRGEHVTNDMRVESVVDGAFIRMHMWSTTAGRPYQAMVMVGRDEGKAGAAGEYVAHWCDSFGAGASAIGRGTRTGDSIEFVFDYPDGPFYNTFTRLDADRWTFKGESGRPDGTRSLFASDVVTRVK
ncbi:MAG: hypothetical protein WCK33_01320 [Phycisphaerae bacterium]